MEKELAQIITDLTIRIETLEKTFAELNKKLCDKNIEFRKDLDMLKMATQNHKKEIEDCVVNINNLNRLVNMG